MIVNLHLVTQTWLGYFLQVQQVKVADLRVLFILISLFDRDHACQHSTTSTCYKQANVTDLVHTETIAISGFQVLSLVIHNTLESLYIERLQHIIQSSFQIINC